MPNILISWIGTADLRAPEEKADLGAGPVAQALAARSFDEAYLLTNYAAAAVRTYLFWLGCRSPAVRVRVVREKLSSPTDFGEIYTAAVRACDQVLDSAPDGTSLTFHLSPGTPAMAAIWIILAKTRFPAELIESSRQHGVRTAAVPFDISADFLPELLRQPDRELERLSMGLPQESPGFSEILHTSRAMQRVVLRARRVALRSIPVLIEGETGTGKELLARAVHTAGPRQEKPFIAVNCGALPPDLVESELFGHKRGAFTGAVAQRDGHFASANNGTLFLDEVGELPKPAQVKLLRVLQEGEILPVGSSRPREVDVRLIAATNRSLPFEVEAGRFRDDLFYRLAVAVFRLPPLRERHEDLALLIDPLLERVNREAKEQPGYAPKKLSVGARRVLLAHSWPGNVRELQNTLCRAALWSSDGTLGTEDVREALLPATAAASRETVLDRPLGEGIDLQGLLADVARHYLARALGEAGGNKTKAARLVGLNSYQTLTNWIRRYGLTQ